MIKCPKCPKTFQYECRLKQHLDRATACDGASKKNTCGCGMAYADRHSLYRHRRQCQTDSPRDSKDNCPTPVHQVSNTQNNFLILGDYNEHKVINNDSPKTPGWPDKWPTPSITPLPFRPPGFSISLDQLTAAVEALPTTVREACNRGDVGATTRLLIELLRQVHADPAERNVYMNPRRGDQALVYVPEHWETCQLDEAGLLLIGRVAAELGHVPKAAPHLVRQLALAASQNLAKQSSQLSRSSRASLAAHLENLRQQTMSGEDWLGTIVAEGVEQLTFFGRERFSHLDPEAVALASEQAAGMWGEIETISEMEGVRMASLALQQCAHMILTGHPENLTVISKTAKEVYVHTRLGWEALPIEEASMIQAEHIASILTDCLAATLPTTPARSLITWLAPGAEAIQLISRSGEVLSRYLIAATRYYGTLRRLSPTDRRQMAKELLSQPPPKPTITDQVLTDADLEELIGFRV